MIERLQSLPEGVFGIRAHGTLTVDDYDEVVRPLLERLRDEGRSVSFLYHFAPDFEGFSAAAAWEDFKVGLEHLRLFERCAVVSDKGWIRDASRAMGALVPVPVRIEDEDGLGAAVEWLADRSRPTVTPRVLSDRGVLVVETHGPVRAEDFRRVAEVADPWIEARGALDGMVIEAEEFPGWDEPGAVSEHLRFVRGHHRDIDRVALCADGAMAKLAPRLADHFVAAEVRHFPSEETERAIAWASGGGG